jgi:hypothetical protein
MKPDALLRAGANQRVNREGGNVLKVTLNGKPLTKDSIEEAIVEQVVAHFRERLGSIRHPETGSFRQSW